MYPSIWTRGTDNTTEEFILDATTGGTRRAPFRGWPCMKEEEEEEEEEETPILSGSTCNSFNILQNLLHILRT
jgi:hypothetical protein